MVVVSQKAEDQMKPSARSRAMDRGESLSPLSDYVSPIHGPKDPNTLYLEGEAMDTTPRRTRTKRTGMAEALVAMERTRQIAEGFAQHHEEQAELANQPYDGMTKR
jgi:hypothetical protein